MAGTKPKRAPGGSPALSFLLAGAKAVVVVATIVVLLAAGLWTWAWYRPDFFVNPINSFVHLRFLQCRDLRQCPVDSEGRYSAGWVSMIPEVFAVGEPRDLVTQRVLEAGYSEWIVDQDEANYQLPGAGMLGLFCSKYYNIRLTFDPEDRLTTAESSSSGMNACL